MNWTRLNLSAVALVAAGLGGAAPAQAAIGFGILPVSIAFSAITPPQVQCRSGQAYRADSGISFVTPNSVSKTTAILGGKVSQLELMAMQQAGRSLPQPASTAFAPTTAAMTSPFGAISDCQQFALPSRAEIPATLGPQISPLGSDDFLASARVSIKHTSFDASWNRVRQESLPRGLTRKLAELGVSKSGGGLLGAVNAWTNARVRDVEDSVQYGQADYWASAKTTLARGAGDCEDVAITKMQLLAAMGVSRSDMFLTITRDLIRNADHAVLVVKDDGKFWLLDNSTDTVLDAANSNSYRPIMSFSTSKSWLHGNWRPNAR